MLIALPLQFLALEVLPRQTPERFGVVGLRQRQQIADPVGDAAAPADGLIEGGGASFGRAGPASACARTASFVLSKRATMRSARWAIAAVDSSALGSAPRWPAASA